MFKRYIDGHVFGDVLDSFYDVDVGERPKFFQRESIEYDDIVDKSSFVLDSESVRNARLGSLSGASGVPVYDGKVLPTSEIVALRSGKLDIADVSQLQRQKEVEVQDTSKRAKADNEKAVAQARLDYLDKSSGFSAERVKLEQTAKSSSKSSSK